MLMSQHLCLINIMKTLIVPTKTKSRRVNLCIMDLDDL